MRVAAIALLVLLIPVQGALAGGPPAPKAAAWIVEAPGHGGLLLAHYGKGIYIFSAYGFSRQLPAGVPGAIRLFVNLVSAGHQ